MKKTWPLPVVVVLTLIGAIGCEPPATSVPESPAPAVPQTVERVDEPITLHLCFTRGQKTRYRLTREYRKQVKWQGVSEDRAADLRDGASTTRLQLGFTQEVTRVDEDASADLNITLTELAYRNQVPDRVPFDFDSQRPADANHPLRALIGSQYRVTLSSVGQVMAVSGLEEVTQKIPADVPESRMAQRLFSEPVVRDRHTLAALAGHAQTDRRVGDTWRVAAVEDFQGMGKQSFHKLYSLSEWVSRAGQRKAVITLSTEPSTRGVNEGSSHPFAGMMDSEREFAGRWELDLSRGEIVHAREDLSMTWRVVVQGGGDASNAAPVLSVMTADRNYALERLDGN